MNVQLKMKLVRSGRTQIQIAHELGVSDSFLSKVVHGWIDPPEDFKSRLARVLGCKASEIFE